MWYAVWVVMTVYCPTLKELSESPPEVVIVGAGIQGVGLARELALRGVSVAVFDQGDIGSGTSSASSKLVHGGLRYLEQGAFRLVREACRERERLLKNVPHLVWKCPFMMPLYQTDKRPLWMVRIGLWLYDFFSGSKQWPKHYFLDARETEQHEPNLKSTRLMGSAVYFDAQMDDARVCLETALHARQLGAKIYTYTPVLRVIKEHRRASGVVVKSEQAGEVTIPAKVVVSCVGPWMDEWADQVGVSVRKPILRPSKGVHLVVKRLTDSEHGLVLTSEKEGRIFFILPWRSFSLIGTTDVDYDKSMSELKIDSLDRQYLLEGVRRYFPSLKISESDIVHEFSSVRPLVDSSKLSVGSLSREHKVVTHFPNFFSLVGGKYTTFRSISERVAKRVWSVLGRRWFKSNLSVDLPLYGGCVSDLDAYISTHYETDTQALNLSKEQYRRLLLRYGVAYQDVMVVLSESLSYLEALVDTSFLKGEVIYAIRNEMVKTLEDFMFRRTQLGWDQDNKDIILEEVAILFSKEFNWSDDDKQVALSKYATFFCD